MNLRTIKKDIEFFVGELLDDCLIYFELSGGANEEEVGQIMGEALDLEDDLREKVNNRPKEIKASTYYKGITKELMEKLDGLYDRLSALSKK